MERQQKPAIQSGPLERSVNRRVAIIGGGPAGLMAAETLAGSGVEIDLYDAMPSVGRKFLLAGKGGLNLTHSESRDAFLSRYAERCGDIEPWLAAFGPEDLRAWAAGLGVETFIGSSGRVFPREMKAAPLLRAWLHRLREAGVRFHVRHRWLGWEGTATPTPHLRFATPAGEITRAADAVILALGGGSWPKLGSDAAWVPLLQQRGVNIAPLKPANCGFDIAWSEHFRSRYAGQPLKTVAASADAGRSRRGECVITETGIEGSLIYALAAPLRDQIEAAGSTLLHLDLLPDKPLERVLAEVAHPRGSRSLSSHLHSRLGLNAVKVALLREAEIMGTLHHAHTAAATPAQLAAAIKSLPLRLIAPRPLAEAISTAGGVDFAELDLQLRLNKLPGVCCAGEMLDWEAPTGGYLLTACFASGRLAGLGAKTATCCTPGE